MRQKQIIKILKSNVEVCVISRKIKKIDPKSLGQVEKELTGRQGGNSRVWI